MIAHMLNKRTRFGALECDRARATPKRLSRQARLCSLHCTYKENRRSVKLLSVRLVIILDK